MLPVTNDSANGQEDSTIWVLHVQGKENDLVDAAVAGLDYVFQRWAKPGRRAGAASAASLHAQYFQVIGAIEGFAPTRP